MSDETYSGWSNRETWAANLWLSNDQGLYNQVCEYAREAVEQNEDKGFAARNQLAAQLEDFYDELLASVYDPENAELGPANHELRTMVGDIGSAWRVNWYEIAESWVADAIAEREDA